MVLCLWLVGVCVIRGIDFWVFDCWWGYGDGGMIRSIEFLKYLIKCYKGLYLYVVLWVGYDD